MGNYKELGKYEKLGRVQDAHYCRSERHTVAVYLNALRKDDTKMTDYYESFGDTPHKFFSNIRSYEQGLLFGFTDIAFDEYGWFKRPHFLDQEQFEFPHKKDWAVSNHITIGRGVNGKWTYGISYSSANGGHGSGISVWDERFNTRKECLVTALQEMLKAHQGEYKDKYSAIILRQVKEIFETVTGRKVVQLSLF